MRHLLGNRFTLKKDKQIKTTNQMAWIFGAMNNIQARTMKIVYADVIYA